MSEIQPALTWRNLYRACTCDDPDQCPYRTDQRWPLACVGPVKGAAE